MAPLTTQITKYGLVGVINTAITFLVISVLTLLDVNPYLSNVIGFVAGLLNSFMLNSRYTFNQEASVSAVSRFSAAFGLAYLINIGTLHHLVSSSSFPEILIQFISMLSYNISFFILMKVWVFSRD